MPAPGFITNRILPSWRSIKVRVTLFTLVVFLLSLWALSLYATQILRKDMQRLLGQQQFSTASMLATQIDRELDNRVKALELVASASASAMQDGPAAVQTYLEQRTVFKTLFNGGVFVVAQGGTAIADVPDTQKRIGVSYQDRDYVIAALHEGQSTISQPLVARSSSAPVIVIASPIHDAHGQIIGAIAGVTRLESPNFLDQVTDSYYGNSGGFALVAPRLRQIVAASDKHRIMEAIPPAGDDAVFDHFIAGQEGSAVLANPQGVEVLASVKKLSSTDWRIAVHRSSAEAFAPIQEMQRHLQWATWLLTLLAGGLSYWLVKRQLSPLLSTVKTLSAMSEPGHALQILPITRHDEIGELISAFNRLLVTLKDRKTELNDSEERYRMLVDWTPVASVVHRNRTFLYVNPAAVRQLGANSPLELLGKSILDVVHPDDHPIVLLRLEQAHGMQVIAPMIEEKFITLDGRVIDVEVQSTTISFEGEPAIFTVIYDLTERKRAERREHFRSHTLERLASAEPLVPILEAIVLGFEQLDLDARCSILLLDREGRHFVKAVAPSLPDYFNAAVTGLAIGPGIGSCGTAAFTGERVITENIGTHPDWADFKALAIRAGLGSCWSQPIHSASGRVLGTFAIYHRHAYAPAATDITLIEQSAHLASIAIERNLANETLRDSEERFRSLMENIPSVAVQGFAQDGTVTFWNRTSEQLYGYNAEEALGRSLLDLIIPPAIRDSIKQAIQQMITTDAPIPASELMLMRKDGSAVPVFSSHALVKSVGRPAELFCLDIDLTASKQAEEKIYLAASVFAHVRDGIIITDAEGTIIDVNESFTRITGYPRDEALGANPRLLKSGLQDERFYAEMWEDLTTSGQWFGEIWNRRKNGELYIEMLTISAVQDAHGETHQYVALFSDISVQKTHQQELEHLAHFDELTSLPNRVLLADRLRQAIAQSQRRGQQLAVAYLDLDGFKAINDRHGHETGNQFLITAANRMKQVLREGDTLARLGGDEFVAILLDLADIEASESVLNRLLTAVALPMQVGDHSLQISASLGLTFYPQEDAVDADQLLRQADQAMYQAKLAGKNRYHVFDSELDRSVRDHHESVEHIRRALCAEEFVLHYQPKVNMRTGKLIGAEALIRWQHPERGLLPPSAFLPIIEKHPLAIGIGEWVIHTALTQVERWRAAGLDITVSVNVGALQLQQANFVERLSGLLAAHPTYRRGDLEMELLETSALEDLTGISTLIESCREIGVLFSLDDFGTGYSSLTYLRRLSVAQLKIDQSFVRDMLNDPDDLSILVCVLNLATAFRREVIAEGVETIEHGTMLLQLGCELAQGYGIARPMPPSDLPDWAKTWRPHATWQHRPAVHYEDLPLLFAGVEHRAWIIAFEAFLHGKRETLPQIHDQCRFGTWLAEEGNALYAGLPAFKAIETTHLHLHTLAATMQALHADHRNESALQRLDDLHELHDILRQQLQELVRKTSGHGSR